MITNLANLGNVGLVKDLPDHDLPVEPFGWSDGNNVRFKGGQVERAPGYSARFPVPSQPLLGLFEATQISGAQYIIGAGTDAVYSYTEDTEFDITGTTVPAASADTRWTGGLFSGFLVLNTAGTTPQYIDVELLSSGSLADLPDWPSSTTCGFMRPWKNFLVAGNMIEGGSTLPYKFRWSSSAVPGELPTSWDAQVDNDAGDVDLDAQDGALVDAIPLGDQLAIYSERGITLARYIGGTDAANNFVFAFNRIPVGVTGGMISNNCGVDVAGVGHVVLSSSDVYVFNGTSLKSILDNRMRRWLFNNISYEYRRRCFVVNNVADYEVMICFPTFGSTVCDKALTWNYADNTLGVRDLPSALAGINAAIVGLDAVTWTNVVGTWSSIAGTWSSLQQAPSALPRTVLSGDAPLLYVIGDGNDNNGSTLTAELTRKYIAVLDAQRVKFFRSVWPRFDAEVNQPIGISIGTSMNVNEEPVWQPEIVFTTGTTRAVYVNRAGRFLAVRVRTSSGSPWRIKSMDVDFQPQGVY